jgi:putative membrane protein
VMAAPILLLYGAPVRLGLLASGRRGRALTVGLLHHPLVRGASTPAVGVTVLVAVLLGTHFTPLFALALRHPVLHELEHAAYLAAGIACFAPLIAADPLPRPPGSLARFACLMIVMTAMTAVGVVLTSDTAVRYRDYLAPARTLHVSAIGDEHLAGVVMWVGGGVAGAALMLAVVMSAMVEEERRQRRRELYAREVAR